MNEVLPMASRTNRECRRRNPETDCAIVLGRKGAGESLPPSLPLAGTIPLPPASSGGGDQLPARVASWDWRTLIRSRQAAAIRRLSTKADSLFSATTKDSL
jgi:hypothetical protein